MLNILKKIYHQFFSPDPGTDPVQESGENPVLGPRLEDGRQVWDGSRGKDYKEFWSSMAESRAGAVVDRDEMHRQCEYLAQAMIRTLQLGKESVVFEVGCGMGAMAWFIAPEVREYHGADISSSMLAHARENLKEFSNVHLHELKSCDLSIFADNRFDAGIFEAVLIHMDREDAYRYMQETFRVLRPGGRAYFMFHSLDTRAGWEIFQTVSREFCDGRGGNHPARNRVHHPEEVRLYCRQAGFEIDEEVSQLNLPKDVGKVHEEDCILVAICAKPDSE